MQLLNRLNQLPIIGNSPPTPLFWMAMMRIMIGLMFLSTWGSNLSKDLYTPYGLENFLRGQLNEDSPEFYRSFLEDVIIPAKDVFAPFQMVSEGLLGLAILFGLFTRPASVIGFFFLLNVYLLSIGTGEWAWSYFLPIGVLGAIFFTNAGRWLGLDAILLKRWGEPKLPLW